LTLSTQTLFRRRATSAGPTDDSPSHRRQRRKLAILARLFPYFERVGLHVTLSHFYEPIPDLRTLPADIFERESELPGLDMREPEQLSLLDQLGRFRNEYSKFTLIQDQGADNNEYYLSNPQYGPVDAEVLYSMIRLQAPKQVIEIGAGYSTLLIARGMRRNAEHDPAKRGRLTSIEPYPRPFLRRLDGLDELIESDLQSVPLERFQALGPGDVLFIDSSHVMKLGSDVQYELLEIIPRLAPGVFVHIHDIFLPTEYPAVFATEWKLFWTEQYAVQAFLQFNSEFLVMWSSNLMMRRHPQRVGETFPSILSVPNVPSSLWLQRRTTP
jgi:predicted O-methyltransferase YrrM